MDDKERYAAAARAMQTGVAFKMQHDPSGTTPKHLRVGVNSAMVSQGGLAALLISKGVFTEEEYTKAVADQMEIEAESYRKWAAEKMGHPGLRFA